MNIKGFFKPTRGKIILTIIFLLIFPLPYSSGMHCVDPECGVPLTYFKPALVGWFFDWFIVAGPSYSGMGESTIGILFQILLLLLIVGLPTSYLLSCLIITIYREFRA